MVFPLLPLAVGVPVGVGIWGLIHRIISRDWPKLRNMFFFPLGGTERPHHAVQRQRVIRRLNGVQLSLTTYDKREISAVWAHPPAGDAVTSAAVMLLGANAMVLDDLLDYAEWYLHRLRLPVLIVNLWSYPDPVVRAKPPVSGGEEDPLVDEEAMGDGTCPSELSTYQDGEAAFAHMQQERGIPADGVLIHGVSIGAAVAAAVAANHPGVRVTMDQPFCTLKEVTRNMTLKVVRGVLARKLNGRRWACMQPVAMGCCAPPLARTLSFLLVRMCFKRGEGGDAAGCLATDMYDNVNKARRIRGNMFIFSAEDDDMMHPDVPRRILWARYAPSSLAEGDDVLSLHSATIPGGHMAFFGDADAACDRYIAALVRTGFVGQHLLQQTGVHASEVAS